MIEHSSHPLLGRPALRLALPAGEAARPQAPGAAAGRRRALVIRLRRGNGAARGSRLESSPDSRAADAPPTVAPTG